MNDFTTKITKIKNKNIDNEEINKFNTRAFDWWNTSNTFKTLHHINSIRLNYILKRSGGLFNKKILDVGCGGGILSESMCYAGANVTGLDISHNSLKIAKLHAYNKNLKITYIQETIEEHITRHLNYRYDIITCMEILEHVPNPLSIVQTCEKLIKIGGSVFFSTLNRTFKSWLFAIIGAEYIFKIIPKGSHNFNKFISPSKLFDWIDSTSLEEQDITGIYYNPFTKTTSLTKNLDINYLIHTQRTQ